jgi:hypothetical protein
MQTSTGPVTIRAFLDRHRGEGWTEPSLRWILFKSSENGLAESGAIVRQGRRIRIDEAAFFCWLRSQSRAA